MCRTGLSAKGIPGFCLVALALLLAACGGGGGAAPDTTAPITATNPGGGTYGSIQSVTLTANEPATIYYSLDGVNPNVGAPNTFSGPSPIAGIQMTDGTWVLKFFGIDGAGNREAVKTQTYIVDLVSPSLSLTTSPPGPMGLLATTTVTWQSDEAGGYVVELGGSGTIGSGTRVALGTVAANTPLTLKVRGTRLSYDGATALWIYVTDSTGHTGSTSVSFSLKPRVPINVGGSLGQVAILPSGFKAYVARSGASVAVIDANPASVTFNTVLAIVPGVGSGGVAVTPDGSRVYVTGLVSIFAIDTSTDTVIATIPFGPFSTTDGIGINGIAITPDGTRAYFLRFDRGISVLDVDPVSPTYHTVTTSIPQTPGLGSIAITPDGARAVVRDSGVHVLDVNPASAAYNTIVSTPVATGYPYSDVAVASDSTFAYATDSGYQLCRINLQSSAIDLTGPFIGQSSFALTPDGTTLLIGDGALRIVDTSFLTVTLDVSMGLSVGRGIAITSDGARAYATLYTGGNDQVAMIPLQ